MLRDVRGMSTRSLHRRLPDMSVIPVLLTLLSTVLEGGERGRGHDGVVEAAEALIFDERVEGDVDSLYGVWRT